MENGDAYNNYFRSEWRSFAADESRYSLLLKEAGGEPVARVLDVGCGAGQELLPFFKEKAAFCVGVDILSGAIKVAREELENEKIADKFGFALARGEGLPFAGGSFDVVICRVALPYMKNDAALAEMSRVLKPSGKLFLKTHAPAFYFAMMKNAVKEKKLKRAYYSAFCLASGTWHLLTGKQLVVKGREVFQTEKHLRKQLRNFALKIVREMPDTNQQTPSYLIVKE
jgi:ubiquinone/menaquinone biosynthesis C-methylase UbiE